MWTGPQGKVTDLDIGNASCVAVWLKGIQSSLPRNDVYACVREVLVRGGLSGNMAEYQIIALHVGTGPDGLYTGYGYVQFREPWAARVALDPKGWYNFFSFNRSTWEFDIETMLKVGWNARNGPRISLIGNPEVFLDPSDGWGDSPGDWMIGGPESSMAADIM